MKSQKNRLGALAIIGSLFALSSSHSGKVQGRAIKGPQQPSATILPASKHNVPGKNQPVDLKSVEELNNHLTAGKPAVLMIHASWCGACTASMNPFAQSAQDNQHVTFLKVEASKEVPQITKLYKIQGYPTFFLFDAQGKEKHKFSGGGWPKSVLNQKIKDHLS